MNVVTVVIAVIIIVVGGIIAYYKTTQHITSSLGQDISFHVVNPTDESLKALAQAEDLVKSYWGEKQYTAPPKVQFIRLTPKSDSIRGIYYKNTLYIVNNVQKDDLIPTIVHELIHVQNNDGFQKKIKCKENTPFGVKDTYFSIGWVFNEMTVEAMTSEIVGDDFAWDKMTDEGYFFWSVPFLVHNADTIFQAYMCGDPDILDSLLKSTGKTYSVNVGDYGDTTYNLSIGDYVLVVLDNYLQGCPEEIYGLLYDE